MSHKHATTIGLAVALLGLAATVVFAQGDDSPVSRGVVATITAIDANTGMATLKTDAGEVFELPQRSQWHVGHQVLCDRLGGSHSRLQQCQLWEDAAQSPAHRAGRFADTEPLRRAEQPASRSAVPVPHRETDIRQELGLSVWEDVGVRGWSESSQ